MFQDILHGIPTDSDLRALSSCLDKDRAKYGQQTVEIEEGQPDSWMQDLHEAVERGASTQGGTTGQVAEPSREDPV